LASDPEKMEIRFNVTLDPSFELVPKNYGVSVGNTIYVITTKNSNLLRPLRFGMTPFYASEPMNLSSARAEGDKNIRDAPDYNGSRAIFLKPEFRKPIQTQRCLVIADAWYGWTEHHKPYLFFLQNKNRPFAMAGIYDNWKNPETGELVSGFAVITTVANDLMRSVGVKRMPVILSRSGERQWVKPSAHLSEILRLLLPHPSEDLNGYPLSELADIPGFNDPTMLNPAGDRLKPEPHPLFTTKGYHSPHKAKGNSGVAWFETDK